MTIKLWIGSLAAYNEGTLRGDWLTLPMPEVELRAALAKLGEEYFIADHEAPAGLVGEYSDPFELNSLADELNEYDIARVAYICNQGYSLSDARGRYEDVIFYEGATLRDVAEQLVDDGCFGDIPDTIASYIDYDAIARDLRYDGYDECSDGVWHFNG